MQARTQSERGAVIDKFLRLVHIRASAQLFSGVIHLSQHDEVPIERAYGLANREDGIPMTIDAKPGSRCEYSNYGFILRGLIIERVTGQSYYDHVREHVVHPAGMPDTDSLPESAPVPRRVVAYRQRDMDGVSPDIWERATDTLPYRDRDDGRSDSALGPQRRRSGPEL